MSGLKVWYTGTLVVSDGSDTNAYGEPCEPGHGYTAESGWVHPDWSTFEVHQERESVLPDVYEPDDDETPVTWLAKRLQHRLNGISDHDGGTNIYAADPIRDYNTREITLAAHPEGFTPEDVATAVSLASNGAL